MDERMHQRMFDATILVHMIHGVKHYTPFLVDNRDNEKWFGKSTDDDQNAFRQLRERMYTVYECVS